MTTLESEATNVQTCHCLVIDGRWRRQADHCPQHVDGETWRDA